LFKTASKFVILIIYSVLLACKWPAKIRFDGYTDTMYLYVSSPAQGYLKAKYVEKGRLFKKNQLLYELDAMPDIANLEQAAARFRQEKMVLTDLMLPKRQPEIAAIKYQIKQTDAELDKASTHYQRLIKLQKNQFVDADTLYANQQMVKELQFQKKQLLENMKLAKLGARPYQIKAQQQAVEEAKYNWQVAKWAVDHKKAVAPSDGYVFEIFYTLGELIPANKPVMSVVLPENNYIEFFVTAKHIQRLHLGQSIKFQYYDEKSWHVANINYIANTAEYMPPILYTQSHQEELVFRVRAKPELMKNFILGQPVQVNI